MTRAEDWPWSSLCVSGANDDDGPKLTTDEYLRRGDWTEFVNAPMTDAEVAAIELSIRRDRPFGLEAWTRATAERLGLQSSLKSPGGQRRRDKTTQST